MEKIPTVLIIDDDKFFLEFYRSELSQHDLKVDLAADGALGLEKAISIKPDIILLDIILPKKDGFEVLSELKKNSDTKNIPVIITSTLGNENDIKKLLDMGAVKNFNKVTALPKDVAVFVKEVISKGSKAASKKVATAETQKSIKIEQNSKEKVKSVITETMKELGDNLSKTFNNKVNLAPLNFTLASLADIKLAITELSKVSGTIYLSSRIKATEPGLIFIGMKRDDNLKILQLAEKEELASDFLNNAHDKIIETLGQNLTTLLVDHLNKSLNITILPLSPVIADPEEIARIFTNLGLQSADSYIFTEQSFEINILSQPISLYVLLGREALSLSD